MPKPPFLSRYIFDILLHSVCTVVIYLLDDMTIYIKFPFIKNVILYYKHRRTKTQ